MHINVKKILWSRVNPSPNKSDQYLETDLIEIKYLSTGS